MKSRFAFAASAAVLGVIIAAGASLAPSTAATPGETVKMRQDAMKSLGGHMKAIKTFIENGEGSADDVARRAAEINEISGKIPGLFPQGTSMDQVMDPKTGAKPAIWSEWNKFTAAAKTLGARSEGLKMAASGGDKGAIAAAFKEMGSDGCGGCHKPYRQKLEK